MKIFFFFSEMLLTEKGKNLRINCGNKMESKDNGVPEGRSQTTQ